MINRLPSWFRQELPGRVVLERVRLLGQSGINTVCREAKCPNINYCFKNSKLTFMILGDTCTRNCRFCAVKKKQDGQELSLDLNEPLRIRDLVKELKLKYAVITSVTRDDLPDAGAKQFARTIRLIRQMEVKVEALIPDFKGNILSLKKVADAGPDVLAHNLETVERLYPQLRPTADYGLSLAILSKIKELRPKSPTKSSLMLGLGETEREVINTMRDLRGGLCDILVMGQYLAPSAQHYPVQEFIALEQFKKYEEIGRALGFKSVLSVPLARSSYQAEKTYVEVSHA